MLTLSISVNVSTYSLGWPGGTFLDNYNDVYKTDSKNFNVSQDTIFTTGTAGLVPIPFVSYFKFLVPSNFRLNEGNIFYDWKIIPTLSDPILDVQVIFGNSNKI
jgi:hypothetical protein